jgi:hypothetical protein
MLCLIVTDKCRNAHRSLTTDLTDVLCGHLQDHNVNISSEDRLRLKEDHVPYNKLLHKEERARGKITTALL